MPTSPARSAAARANGAKSRGPKTAEGKQISSRNATTHGLTARTVVLHNESEAQFETDLRAYLDHFRPQTKPETDLVHQLAAAQWRLARYIAIEAALFENKMTDQSEWLDDKYEVLPEPNRLAIAFESLASNGSLALLNRYQARLHREYQRLLKTLTDLQAARRAAEMPPQNFPNEPKRVPDQPAAHRPAPLPVTIHAPHQPAPPLDAGLAPPLPPKLPCVSPAP
jgi:hypothetical protein